MRQIRYVYLVVMDAFYTFLADDGWAIASHIALSALMALFPFLIVLTSLAGFFGSKELADQAVALLLQVWPQQVADSLSSEIHDVLTTTRGDALTIGLVLAVYFASNGVESLRVGLNRAYSVIEPRSWYWLRLESIGYTLIAAFTALAMAFLLRPSQPASTYFTSSGQGRYLRVGQAVMQHLHDRQAGIEADEVGQLQRPHRVVGAQPHGGVDRLDLADAFIQRVDRLVDHRHQDAVDDEGREIFGDRRWSCRALLTNSRRSSKVSSSVAMPRISSTSFITGTGFMKCRPMKCSGRSVDAARRVIEIDEVLEARIASGFSMRAESAKILRLTSSFSVAASMTRSTSPKRVELGAGVMRASAACCGRPR